MLIRILTALLFWGLVSFNTVAQDHPLYQLEGRLMGGDKNALFEIANYFDSDNKVTESLGYHLLKTTESQIAKRIVNENCLFTENEIKITDTTTEKQFTEFLNRNKNTIKFSEFGAAFLITPLEKRKINFKIREISESRKKELETATLLNLEWVKLNKIDLLIEKKNPLALLIIASELFKERNRFNRYYFNEDEFTDLLQYLTATETGVEDEEKEISWHADKDYYPESKLNLLIYFSCFYKQYSWDNKRGIFVNPNNKILPIGKEEMLFELLNSKNDSIASDAFTQLTICNPVKVNQLANEYLKGDIDKNNHAIPIFPYNFLKQIVVLIDYCRANNIDYAGSAELRNKILLLRNKLSFAERYKLENELIDSLTLDNITVLEYWSLIHEQPTLMAYSAGRILDVFYSRNWNELLADKKQLDLYLKKSKLFKELNIIGNCNVYLRKFSNSSQTTLALLNNYQSSDSDILEQVEKIISLNKIHLPEIETVFSNWEGNKDYKVDNLEEQLIQLTTHVQDFEKNEDELTELLSKINYEQIPLALKYIEDFPFKYPWRKYTFMESDWGFFMIDDFGNKETREEFLKIYSQYNEFGLYCYYLDKAGIDYKNPDSTLNYDKIYEMLKYDVVVAFVGGGGGTRDNEVYALVKVLELTFNTTLGFPHKLCNSNGVWACDSYSRTKKWMKYLEDKNLLKQKHDEPEAYHYGWKD